MAEQRLVSERPCSTQVNKLLRTNAQYKKKQVLGVNVSRYERIKKFE
jgi:hypothetical protein